MPPSGFKSGIAAKYVAYLDKCYNQIVSDLRRLHGYKISERPYPPPNNEAEQCTDIRMLDLVPKRSRGTVKVIGRLHKIFSQRSLAAEMNSWSIRMRQQDLLLERAEAPSCYG